MNIIRNSSVVCLLAFVVFSFSGCTVRKAEQENAATDSAVTAVPLSDIDTDGDGLSDGEEKEIGTDINMRDTDGDELSDFDEVKTHETDPIKPDSDGDGYEDKQELDAGYDPNGTGQLNSDPDGLGDADEKKLGTDPKKFDTDGDGISDKEEIDASRDPLAAGK